MADNVLVSGGKKFAKKSAKRLLASTAPTWVPIAAVAIIIALIFLVFISIIGAAASSIPFADQLGLGPVFRPPTSSPTPTPSSAPTEAPSRCRNNNYIACLREDFNFVVRSVNQDRARDLYEILSEVGVSSRYKRLLQQSGPTVVEYLSGTNCAARVQPFGAGNLMTLYNFTLANCRTRANMKDRIVHESGHAIRNGNMRLFQRYESEAYYPKDNTCYNIDRAFRPSAFIKTYSTAFAKQQRINISGSNESMADSIALYVDPRAPLSNFRSQCPKGYNWVRENIFGGVAL